MQQRKEAGKLGQPQMAESFGRKEAGGVLVADVTADSPAEKAGLKSGDIIVELNGKKVDDNLTFRKTIANMAPGSVIKLGVFREGKQRAINVTVGQFPDEQESRSGAAGDAESITSKIGLDVQDLDADLAGRLGYDGQKGVVITEVQSGSLAEEAGLKSGMLIVEVNRKDVANVRQFEAELRKVKRDNLLLRVKADGRTVFVNIKVN
jgi:serine protease Do